MCFAIYHEKRNLLESKHQKLNNLTGIDINVKIKIQHNRPVSSLTEIAPRLIFCLLLEIIVFFNRSVASNLQTIASEI